MNPCIEESSCARPPVGHKATAAIACSGMCTSNTPSNRLMTFSTRTCRQTAITATASYCRQPTCAASSRQYHCCCCCCHLLVALLQQCYPFHRCRHTLRPPLPPYIAPDDCMNLAPLFHALLCFNPTHPPCSLHCHCRPLQHHHHQHLACAPARACTGCCRWSRCV